MDTDRLEAFSDGVMAIVITIMVFQLHPPLGSSFVSLREDLPHLATYALSFLIIATYWNNHHHLLKATKSISPGVMWANMHFLFWISLIPFATVWLSENHHYLDRGPVLFYASLGMLSGFAYFLLAQASIRKNPDTEIARRLRQDQKGPMSLYIYIAAIGVAFIQPLISLALVFSTVIIWFTPDRRLDQSK